MGLQETDGFMKICAVKLAIGALVIGTVISLPSIAQSTAPLTADVPGAFIDITAQSGCVFRKGISHVEEISDQILRVDERLSASDK